MKNLLCVIFGLLLIFGASISEANVITLDGYVDAYDDGTGSVDYQYFNLDAMDDVLIYTTEVMSFDPYMYLFSDDGDLTADDLIAFNDDSGEQVDTNSISPFFYNAQLSLSSLDAGDYIVAIGDFNLDTGEAVAGMNQGGGTMYTGSYDLVINADSATVTDNANAPVPEPATMLLLGTGLIGLAGFRKKFKK